MNIAKKLFKRSPVDIIKTNSKGETRLWLFLAFLVPFLIIWGIFAYYEMHPFGDKQILVIDLWHQYFPFFREEHLKLSSGSSLLYSWNTGMGTNFLSVMSYYTASPLNLLAMLFPLEYSRDALTLFLTIKIGCSGLFFAIFLKHAFGRNDISIVAFGTCYALCNYMIGYYWCLIWMDTFALLPLVVLGTVKLVREGKYKLYIISLMLSVVSNFYIGLFTCVFTVMIFAGAVIVNWKGFKNALLRLGQITGATIISLGLGAILLIPAYYGLMLTYSAHNTFPEETVIYRDWFELMSNVIGFHDPTSKEGLPNFYCGMFAIPLLGVFLINSKIKIREKIVTVTGLAFIAISCNINKLDFMWHGFHVTNMLPFRFSFLFSFLLLAAAYRAFTVMTENKSIFDIIAMGIMMCSIYLIACNDQPGNALFYSIIACGAYIVIMLAHNLGYINRDIMNIAVAAVCVLEMGWNAYEGVKTVGSSIYATYPQSEEDVNTLLGLRENEDTDFYRTEFTRIYSHNDPALYGVKGVSQFSSTANVNVTRFLKNLGVQASEAGNRYYYTHNTPFITSILNIRYLITRNGINNDSTYLDKIDDLIGSNHIYENNAYLPLMFVADSSLLEYSGSDEEAGVNQNELFRRMTGIKEDFLIRLPVHSTDHKNITVTEIQRSRGNVLHRIAEKYKGILAEQSLYTEPVNTSATEPANGRYYCHYDSSGGTEADSDECSLKFEFITEKCSPAYVMMHFGNMKNNDFKVNGRSFSYQKHPSINAVGDYMAGSTLNVTADIDKNAAGSGPVYAYQINEEVFRSGIEKLSKGGATITSYDNTSIEGTFTAEEDGVLYTSIPYDGGWKAYIDGRETEITGLKDAVNCIPVTKGSHTIRLEYTPPGFVAGLIISVWSLIAFAAFWFVEAKYLKPYFAKKAELRAKALEEQRAAEEEASEEKAGENEGEENEASGSGSSPDNDTKTDPEETSASEKQPDKDTGNKTGQEPAPENENAPADDPVNKTDKKDKEGQNEKS